MGENLITHRFNIVLFLFVMLSFIGEILANPKFNEESLLTLFYKKYPTPTNIVILLLLIIVIFGVTKLTQVFWNRLVSDIFNLREINYKEAFSIILVCALLLL